MEVLPLVRLGLASTAREFAVSPGDMSPPSPLRADSPPLAPQIGVTEAGLQRAILRRAQEILAVAKTIPGTASSFLEHSQQVPEP